MSAAHDDRGPGEHTPSTDVSEAEAEAIAGGTSADQIDDAGLVAPTTGGDSPTAPASDVAGDPIDGCELDEFCDGFDGNDPIEV